MSASMLIAASPQDGNRMQLHFRLTKKYPQASLGVSGRHPLCISKRLLQHRRLRSQPAALSELSIT